MSFFLSMSKLFVKKPQTSTSSKPLNKEVIRHLVVGEGG